MKTMLRRVSPSVSRAHGSWLTLLLLLAVLLPSVCLLWFMNQAVRNERLAVREKLVEAYRGHVAQAQVRLETSWKQATEELEALAEITPAPALFARQIRADLADAVVIFDAADEIVYPSPARLPESRAAVAGWAAAQRLESQDPGAAANAYARLADQAAEVDQAALAWQAQARCLVQAGSNAAALAVLTGPLADERYLQTTDGQGRRLVLNAELMALELLKNSEPGRTPALRERLRQQLLDYDDPAVPASQRRFLMRELQRLFPEESLFSMLDAEELAARYVEANLQDSREPRLRATSLPEIWQFASTRGRVVTLHRIENLRARMQSAASPEELPQDVRLDFVAPGRKPDESLLSMPAGPTFPGWNLALSLQDPRFFDAATNERITIYTWTGVLVLAIVIVLAMLALGMARRQAALTRLRNDLVANVTHELKTPLSSMRLFVDTLLDSPQLHEETAREYLELIAKENLRLSRLIDNFLTFSRIERNKYTFDFSAVPAATLVENAAAAVRDRFNVPGCQFTVEIAPDLPPVMAETDAMMTVLVNLLDNAWKYSGETKQITLAAKAENGTVAFRVQDNGIGLSHRDRKRIFKRFYQVNQHLFTPRGGCGLGLSIVELIVTMHHGTVRVQSEPNRGSTFIVTIPATSSRACPETKA